MYKYPIKMYQKSAEPGQLNQKYEPINHFIFNYLDTKTS